MCACNTPKVDDAFLRGELCGGDTGRTRHCEPFGDLPLRNRGNILSIPKQKKKLLKRENRSDTCSDVDRPGDTGLGEVVQPQKDTSCVSLLHEVPGEVEVDRSWFWVGPPQPPPGVLRQALPSWPLREACLVQVWRGGLFSPPDWGGEGLPAPPLHTFGVCVCTHGARLVICVQHP